MVDGDQWERVRSAVLRRNGHACRRCGCPDGTYETAPAVHHVVPVSEGGARWDARNLETICHACHMAEHARGD